MYSRGKYYNSIVGVINYPLYSHLIGSIYIGVMIPIILQIYKSIYLGTMTPIYI